MYITPSSPTQYSHLPTKEEKIRMYIANSFRKGCNKSHGQPLKCTNWQHYMRNNKTELRNTPTHTLRGHGGTVEIASGSFLLARSEAPHQLTLQCENEALGAICAHKNLVLYRVLGEKKRNNSK